MPSRLLRIQRWPRCLREGGIVLLDQGLLSLTTLVTGILVARGTGQESYGLYVLCWSLLVFLQGFGQALTGRPLTLLLPRLADAQRRGYQGSVLLHLLLLCGLVSAGLVMVGFSARGELLGKWQPLLPVAPVLAWVLFPYVLREFLRSALMAHLRFGATLLPNILGSLVQLGLVLILFATNKLSLTATYTVIGLGSALAVLAMARLALPDIALEPRRFVADFLHNWPTSKWLVAGIFVFTVASQIYPWLLIHYLNAVSVAQFGACMALAAVLAPLFRGINSYLLPRMSHGFREGGAKKLGRMTLLATGVIFLAVAPVGVLCTFLADEILTFFFAEGYTGLALLVGLLMAKVGVENLAVPATNALQIRGSNRDVFLGWVLAAVVSITVGPWAIQMWGLVGAGIAGFSASLVSALFRWYRLARLRDW